jgi:hypothetical protein
MLRAVGDDLEEESALIARFLTRSPADELAMVNRLRPLIVEDLKKNWKGLWRSRADLEQEALLGLWQRRQAGVAIDPPLTALAKSLVDGPARKLRRQRATVALFEDERQVEPNQLQQAMAREMVAAIAELGPEHRTTLLLHTRHLTEGGPALHEALQIEEQAAKRRLVRAQAAAMALLAAKEDQAESETDHG